MEIPIRHRYTSEILYTHTEENIELSILDLKTTSELFPTVALLASFEHEDGREVCYNFRVDVSEYEQELSEATGLDQEGAVHRLGENSINVKEDFIQFYNEKVEELGILEFMHQYELQFYKNPTKVLCSYTFGKGGGMACKPANDAFFVIKEEYPGNVVFLY